ncbi:uncharacterized protein LOC135390582 [Ornithodoros turicata]|uniref:uncharacterized protein LOC135390582 n=1 Tax=Ornithodoros turicata TaxID=34597 RepID=UPI003139758C
MRFHNVHGGNVLLDEGGKRATRTTSFCDGLAFSSKPLAVGSKVTLLLGANETWTGALRLGVMLQDPTTLGPVPKHAYPDLTARQGFWVRSLPECWATHGSKLTFYVNTQGYLQLFVDNEYKGALLSCLPTKERLWLILDLFGTSISAKFVPSASTAPAEVIARGPDAVRAYRTACNDGSVPLYRTRLYIIGCPGAGKTTLKRTLLNDLNGEDTSLPHWGIDAVHDCRTSEKGDGAPWTPIAPESLQEIPDREYEDTAQIMEEVSHVSEEEYHKAVAINVVREMTLQQRKRQHQEEKKRLAQSRGSVKSQGLRNRNHANDTRTSSGNRSQHANTSKSNGSQHKDFMEGIPQDLPYGVVEMVEKMLRDTENKQDLDVRETEKAVPLTCSASPNAQMTFMIWDFDGSPQHFMIHQNFFSPQGIYLLVYDLSKDLSEPLKLSEDTDTMEHNECLSTLDYIHQWLTLVHVSASRLQQDHAVETKDDPDTDVSQLLPSVILVGTHRDDLDDDVKRRNDAISEKFSKIRESLHNKLYGRHVLPMYFSVDCNSRTAQSGRAGADDNKGSETVDDVLEALRRKVERVASRMDSVGTDVPVRWLAFERALRRLLDNGVYFAGLYQLEELARQERIDSEENFRSLLDFLHQQGKVLCIGALQPGCLENRWDGTVVLRPQWYIDSLYRLLSWRTLQKVHNTGASTVDIDHKPLSEYHISYRQLQTLWSGSPAQVEMLIATMDSLDVLIAHFDGTPIEANDDAICAVPWLATSPRVIGFECGNLPSSDALVFFVDFSGLLPVGLFSRLVARLLHWCDWREASLFKDLAVFPLDRDHDLLLRLHRTIPAENRDRIQVVIQRTPVVEEWMGNIPQPTICEKVRHLVECELEALRKSYYFRLSFRMLVTCPCKGLHCMSHGARDCQDQACLHFLSLDECLLKKLVYCDFRRVHTDFVRRHFPHSTVYGSRMCSAGIRRSSSIIAWEAERAPLSMGMPSFEWDDRYGTFQWEEPHWIREAAKLLENATTGKDWMALAKRLGYTDKEVCHFVEEANPGVSLLRDWRESNGATRYCMDVLASCLQQMGRQDIAKIIQGEIEPDTLVPPVFISYQWDAQETVLSIRQHLEFAGFPCWMDVGQMGGGDSLYGKIYEGISRAKVVLCCLTPRYAASPSCAREVSLADVLRKPIIPIMVEPTPWPPPGPQALVMGSLVYVDLCGVGGHGGSGRLADWEARFQEIINRVAHVLSGSPATQGSRPQSSHKNSLAPLLGAPPIKAATPSAQGSASNSGPNDEDGELPSTASGPLDDERQSNMSHPESLESWERPRRAINRVVRCSVCSLL